MPPSSAACALDENMIHSTTIIRQATRRAYFFKKSDFTIHLTIFPVMRAQRAHCTSLCNRKAARIYMQLSISSQILLCKYQYRDYRRHSLECPKYCTCHGINDTLNVLDRAICIDAHEHDQCTACHIFHDACRCDIVSKRI